MFPSSAGENKRHFQKGECFFSKTTITGAPGNTSENTHTGYTVDMNLKSVLSVHALGYTLKREGHGKNP